ncbi:MAG: signal peptidase I [Acidobacteriaceae bacterium]
MSAPHHTPADRDGVLTMLKSVLEIVVFAVFIVTFIVQPFRIPSGSMEPTLLVGNFLLVDKQSYGPAGELDRLLLPPTRVERGNLVVFHYPVEPALRLVKRVVGIPGDHIRMRGGRVLVNGNVLKEPYAYYSPSRPNGYRDDFPSLLEADPNVDLRWWITLRNSVRDGQVTVPANEYFVLGDNRNDSEDSRYWGFVPRSAIVGRPLLVYFTLPMAEDFHGDSALSRVRDTLRTGVGSWRILR